MSDIIIIVAIAQNNAIGKDGDIPWRIKEDFLHFKELTMGYPCIMGDKTYESLPANARPLPGRENIILTLEKDYRPTGIIDNVKADVIVLHDFNEAISYCKKKGVKKAFITGGATIYKLGLEVANYLELTQVHNDYAADTFFPKIDFSKWELIHREDKEGKDMKNGEKIEFSYLTYKRRRV